MKTIGELVKGMSQERKDNIIGNYIEEKLDGFVIGLTTSQMFITKVKGNPRKLSWAQLEDIDNYKKNFQKTLEELGGYGVEFTDWVEEIKVMKEYFENPCEETGKTIMDLYQKNIQESEEKYQSVLGEQD